MTGMSRLMETWRCVSPGQGGREGGATVRHLAPAEDDFDGWLFSGEHVWSTGHTEKWDGGGGRRGCVWATGHTEPIGQWPPPPMICGPLHTTTAAEGGEDAWRPTRGAFYFKKKIK